MGPPEPWNGGQTPFLGRTRPRTDGVRWVSPEPPSNREGGRGPPRASGAEHGHRGVAGEGPPIPRSQAKGPEHRIDKRDWSRRDKLAADEVSARLIEAEGHAFGEEPCSRGGARRWNWSGALP